MKTKKLFAVILSAILILGILPFSAFAEESEPVGAESEVSFETEAEPVETDTVFSDETGSDPDGIEAADSFETEADSVGTEAMDFAETVPEPVLEEPEPENDLLGIGSDLLGIGSDDVPDEIREIGSRLKQGEEVSEEDWLKVLDFFFPGQTQLDLSEYAASADASGDVRKILLTQCPVTLKIPVTIEPVTYEEKTAVMPLTDSYIAVKDDIVLVQTFSTSPGEGDTLSIGDCLVSPGNNEITEGSILLILDGDGVLYCFRAASAQGGSLTLGKALNVYRGIETYKLKGSIDNYFGPIHYDWAGGDNWVDIGEGDFVYNLDLDFDWYHDWAPEVNLRKSSFEVKGLAEDEKDASVGVHLDSELGKGYEIPIIEVDCGVFYDIVSASQGIVLTLDGEGTGDVDFGTHIEYGFYFDIYFDYVNIEFDVIDKGIIDDNPSVDVVDCTMDGDMFMGIAYSYVAKVVEYFGVGATVAIGPSLEGEKSDGHFFSWDTDKKYWHECEKGECYCGECDIKVGRFSVDGYVGDDTIHIWGKDGYKDKLFDYYDSQTFDDRDFTECPHRGYRLNLNVDDSLQTKTSFDKVWYTPVKDHYKGAASGEVDFDDKAVLYAPAGETIDVSASATSNIYPDWTISTTKTITKKADTEDLELCIDLPLVNTCFKNSIAKEATNWPKDESWSPFYSSTAYVTSNIPEITGLQFLEWNTEKDGSGISIAPDSFIPISRDSRGDIMLWAQWDIPVSSWYIIYKGRGGTNVPKAQIVSHGEDATLSTQIPENGKMKFKGWATEPNAAEAEYQPGDTLPYDKEKNLVELYAVWEMDPVPEPIHISFDDNGIEEAVLPPDVWIEKDQYVMLNAAYVPYGSEYEFLGWSKEKDSKEPEYLAGRYYYFDDDCVLYAVWGTQDPITLTFEDSLPSPSSGIPNPIEILPTMSRNVLIPGVIPEKAGMAFTGWNTEKDGSGKSYAPGTEIILYTDTTLWAQWASMQSTWYVVYDANGGTDAPAPQIVEQGKDADLSYITPKADKMIFKGWTPDLKTMDPVYQPGDTLPYDSEKNVVVLYALWELSPVPEPVHISFDANGLEGASVPADIWLEKDTWLQMPAGAAPYGSAYVFRGWSENKESTEPEYLAGESYYISRNAELYAIWEKLDPVTLTFKDSLPGGSSGIPDPIEILPSMSRNVRIPGQIPEKGGMQFTSWNTEKDGSGTSYAPGSIITLDGDTTLWAQWEKAESSWYIVYDANGGTKAPDPQIVPQGEDAVLTTEIPVAGEMIFKGWATDPHAAQAEYQPGDTLPYDSEKNTVVLYALWELSPVVRPVHVSYDANGMEGASIPADIWLEQYSWLQLPVAVAPYGGAYVFRGWSTDKEATEPEYLAGQSYYADRDTLFYAIWEKQETMTLTFSDSLPGSASGIPSPITIVPSMSRRVQIPSQIPEKSGMQFLSWNTAKDGSGTAYAPGSVITLDDDTTLWAQWEKAERSWYIIYDANGGTKAPDSQIVPQGEDAVVTTELPEAGALVFIGWATSPNAAEAEYQPGDTLPYDSSKSMVVLYALWEISPVRRPVNILFDGNGGKPDTVPEKISVMKDVWFKLPEQQPSWDPQHDFLGWSTDPKAAEPIWKAGHAALFDKDTTLYAVWNVHYTVTEGAGSVWTKGSGKTQRFVADGNIGYFRELQIDGKALSEGVQITDGSTIADISAAAMEKLSAGKHTVTFVYKDGTASADFQVKDQAPPTGDRNNIILWLALMMIALLGLGTVIILRRRKSEK